MQGVTLEELSDAEVTLLRFGDAARQIASLNSPLRSELAFRMAARGLFYSLLEPYDYDDVWAERQLGSDQRHYSRGERAFVALKPILKWSLHHKGAWKQTKIELGSTNTLMLDTTVLDFTFQIRARENDPRGLSLFYWTRRRPVLELSFSDFGWTGTKMHLEEFFADLEAIQLRGTSDTLEIQLFNTSNWATTVPSDFAGKARSEREWEFWHEWLDGYVAAQPMPKELIELIWSIPDAVWHGGPVEVAERIEEIRTKFEEEQAADRLTAPIDKPVSPEAAKAMAKHFNNNRDAVALTTASLLEQIADFREKVRGNNQLDPDLKKDYLAFLDNLSEQLSQLLCLLPGAGNEPDDEKGEEGVRWLRSFKASLFTTAKKYVDPDNVADATIPTGIILGCTGVGTLLGMPVAGTVIGGLLTGQLKPGKAADDLLKPNKPDAE